MFRIRSYQQRFRKTPSFNAFLQLSGKTDGFVLDVINDEDAGRAGRRRQRDHARRHRPRLSCQPGGDRVASRDVDIRDAGRGHPVRTHQDLVVARHDGLAVSVRRRAGRVRRHVGRQDQRSRGYRQPCPALGAGGAFGLVSLAELECAGCAVTESDRAEE